MGGYASMEYDALGYRRNKLVKLDVKLNGEEVDPLAVIVHNDDAYRIGRALCVKLKEFIPRQQFKVPIRACIGAKVIAATQIQAVRKDVLAKLRRGHLPEEEALAEAGQGEETHEGHGQSGVPAGGFHGGAQARPERDVGRGGTGRARGGDGPLIFLFLLNSTARGARGALALK